MLNPYTLYSNGLAEKINNFYIKPVQKAPAAFGAAYSAGQLYRRLPVHSPVYFANYGMVSRMEEYLSRNHFDIIITMPRTIPASRLRRKRSAMLTLFHPIN